MINQTISIELSAADLHNLNVDIEAFRIGDNVEVMSKPHGLRRYFLLSKLHLALDSVSSCSMTLGATFKTFTQKQIENEKKINTNVQNAVGSVNEVKQNVNNLDKQVQELNTVIQDVPTEYVKTSIFENYKQEVNKKLFGIYTIKGNVDKFEDLPTEATVGDVYNVLDTGANYVWTDDDEWDKLSETIDLSNYVEKQLFEDLEKRVEDLENKEEK